MEYVKGLPITEHCDRNKLSNRERLDLFREVCEGVQHAHQKAIIHRDLKPSNVLVNEQDGKRVPKIIDFGIAKATAQRLTEKTMFTELGALLGTPEYMSPEQADLTGEDVDTRTDVYSLGVILYELLVGALPFDSKELRSGGFEGIRKKIREEEPRRPSVRLSTLGDRATDSARVRGLELQLLQKELRGDLDWITMRALEKDRARRYASAADLARDLGRYLADEPVWATPPSAGYRARKFVRRHRVAVVTASLLALALIAGAAGTTLGLLRARSAEREALAQSADSDRVSRFLGTILKDIDPGSIGKHLRTDLDRRMEVAGSLDEVNVLDVAQALIDREIFSPASAMIERDLQEDPELAARLHFTIGEAYNRGLLLYPRAVESLRHALELARQSPGPAAPLTQSVAQELALALNRVGGTESHEEALALLQEQFEILTRERRANDLDLLDVRMMLGDTQRYLGQREEAERVFRALVPDMRAAVGPDDPNFGYVLNDLALAIQSEEEKQAEAESLFREAADEITRVLGPDHYESFSVRLNLARLLHRVGRYEEVVVYLQEMLDSQRRALGSESDLTAQTLSLLAASLRRTGRAAEAIPLYEESIRSRLSLVDVGRRDEAERILTDFERELGASRDPDLTSTHRIVLYNLACVSSLREDRKAGLTWLRRAVEIGWDMHEEMAVDPDLVSLHGPEFDALVEQAKANAEAGS